MIGDRRGGYDPAEDEAVISQALSRLRMVDIDPVDFEEERVRSFVLMSLVAQTRPAWRTELVEKFRDKELDPEDLCGSLSFGDSLRRVGERAHKLYKESLEE
jgi:hypothetical protein